MSDSEVPMRAKGSTLVNELKLDWGLRVRCEPSCCPDRRKEGGTVGSTK